MFFYDYLRSLLSENLRLVMFSICQMAMFMLSIRFFSGDIIVIFLFDSSYMFFFGLIDFKA